MSVVFLRLEKSHLITPFCQSQTASFFLAKRCYRSIQLGEVYLIARLILLTSLFLQSGFFFAFLVRFLFFLCLFEAIVLVWDNEEHDLENHSVHEDYDEVEFEQHHREGALFNPPF